MSIKYFLDSKQREIFSPSSFHNNQPKQSQWTIASINLAICSDSNLFQLISSPLATINNSNDNQMAPACQMLHCSVYFWLPVLLGNYHGVEKENLSLPFISIKFSIACGTIPWTCTKLKKLADHGPPWSCHKVDCCRLKVSL